MKEKEKLEIVELFKDEVSNVRRGIQCKLEQMTDEFRRLRKEQIKLNKIAIKTTEDIAILLEKNVNINEQIEISAGEICLGIRQKEFLQAWYPDKKETEKKAWPKEFK